MPRQGARHKVRDRLLSREEAATYTKIREQIEHEKTDIGARHKERVASQISVAQTFSELKRLRQERGLSLRDMRDLTGMDRSALSKLETGRRANPTIDTMVRYAQAVGKKLVVALVDEE